MSDFIWKALVVLFGITMVVVAIFVAISLIYYVSSPIVSLVKDAICDFIRRIDNKKGIDTDIYYDVIKVKNLATTRRKLPDYCFVCDAKTGNVYQITNGRLNDEVILNYYENSLSKCEQCGCHLESRVCSYCGSESPDYLDIEFIFGALAEYGFRVKGFSNNFKSVGVHSYFVRCSRNIVTEPCQSAFAFYKEKSNEVCNF